MYLLSGVRCTSVGCFGLDSGHDYAFLYSCETMPIYSSLHLRLTVLQKLSYIALHMNVHLGQHDSSMPLTYRSEKTKPGFRYFHDLSCEKHCKLLTCRLFCTLDRACQQLRVLSVVLDSKVIQNSDVKWETLWYSTIRLSKREINTIV